MDPVVNEDKTTRTRLSYEQELSSYDDMWDEIHSKGKINIRTSEQMKRYRQYIRLLMEYMSFYE